MATIHKFETTGEAYDATQCDPKVQKGDFLFIPSEGVIGIAETWPFALTKAHGALHVVADNNDGIKLLNQYRRQVIEAVAWAESLGYAVPDMFNR